jgi:hypothetical protein
MAGQVRRASHAGVLFLLSSGLSSLTFLEVCSSQPPHSTAPSRPRSLFPFVSPRGPDSRVSHETRPSRRRNTAVRNRGGNHVTEYGTCTSLRDPSKAATNALYPLEGDTAVGVTAYYFQAVVVWGLALSDTTSRLRTVLDDIPARQRFLRSTAASPLPRLPRFG